MFFGRKKNKKTGDLEALSHTLITKPTNYTERQSAVTSRAPLSQETESKYIFMLSEGEKMSHSEEERRRREMRAMEKMEPHCLHGCIEVELTHAFIFNVARLKYEPASDALAKRNTYTHACP